MGQNHPIEQEELMAYLDGELCAVRADGVPVFRRLQVAMDEGRTDELILFVFDLLFLDGESLAALPVIERKDRLRSLLKREVPGLRFSDHVIGDGPHFRAHACKLGLEGIVSKRLSAPYRSGPTRDWIKVKNPHSAAMQRARAGMW